MEDIENTREIALQSELDKLRKRNKLLLVFLVFFMIVAVFFFIANTKIRNNSNRIILTLNQGMVKSLGAITSKNEKVFWEFQIELMENPLKVKPYFDSAMKARDYSEDMVKFISYLKTQMIADAEFGVKWKFDDPDKWSVADSMSLINIDSKNNCNIPKEILNGPSYNGSSDRATELKKKLEDYYKKISDFFDTGSRYRNTIEENRISNFAFKYDFSGRKVENWVDYYFMNNSLVEDIALFNKLIIDIRVIEGDVISSLVSNIGSYDNFRWFTIGCFVIPESTFIHVGDQYKAGILLAAYDSKKPPDVYIGDTITHVGKKLDNTKNEKGLVEYTAFASSPGKKVYTGWVSIVKPGATSFTYYNFSGTYIVGNNSSNPN